MWLKVISGFSKIRSTYAVIALFVTACTGSMYIGYSYCDYKWQGAKIKALEEAKREEKRLKSLLAQKQNEVAKSKQMREEHYRESKRVIANSAPVCELDSERLQELVCAVRPSECQW
jgi:hypothetical protein